MEALPGIWSLSPLGALIGVLVVFFLLLATGKIITKSSHERELALVEKRATEWKETALDQREVNHEIRKQNTVLIESQRITTDFFGKITPTELEDTGRHDVGA